MRWTPGKRSDDIEDRRGSSGRRLAIGGGGMGIGGILILLVLSLVFKKNFFALLGPDAGLGGATAEAPSEPYVASPEEEKLTDFVSFVLDDAQAFWQAELPRHRVQYPRARLVLFTDSVDSGCGSAGAETGPFYCPADQQVYIDLGFYRELQQRFGAPGDFAQAYVIAHEIGHHVQHVLGIDTGMRRAQQDDPSRANEFSIQLELQADCLAGVWGHSTANRNILEAGDVEEGLAAAAAIGDDRLQRQASGRVQPEKWTHGSSAQRVEWFRRGFESGDIDRCETGLRR